MIGVGRTQEAPDRRLGFTNEILEDWRTSFSDVCQHVEAILGEFDGERDHGHLLITYPPEVVIARLVNSLKGVSSRLIRKTHYPTSERALWGGGSWSPSYFAGSAVGTRSRSIGGILSNSQPRVDPCELVPEWWSSPYISALKAKFYAIYPFVVQFSWMKSNGSHRGKQSHCLV